MTMKMIKSYLEFLVFVVILVIAVMFIWSAKDLPSNLREPLGSGTIPVIVSLLVAAFSVYLAVKSIRRIPSSDESESDPDDVEDLPAFRKRYDKAFGCFLLALALATTLQTRWIPSEVTIPAFIFGLIWVLNDFRARLAPVALIVSLAVGLGSTYAFKTYFYINLP